MAAACSSLFICREKLQNHSQACHTILEILNNRMIAVTFALPDESSVFISHLSGVRVIEKGPLHVLSGTFGRLEIVVFHTGVGLNSAQTRLDSFFTKQKFRLLISSGFAGGLDPSLQIADLIVGTNVSTEQMVSIARRAFSNDNHVFFGALTTQQTPAESVASKQSLAAATGALAVDMETAAISSVCADASIPMLSLRGISDTSLQSLPVPFSSWFNVVSQRPRPLALVRYLIFHPSVIPPFVRFVRGVFKAKKTLASKLSDYLAILIDADFGN